MEVRVNHLPMCTGPTGTCPSGMVLHIENFALHGLISHRDHSNVNHISSLILSNTCIKPLIYQSIAQRHYNDLQYKAEEKDKTPYWANIHKKRNVSRGPSMPQVALTPLGLPSLATNHNSTQGSNK
jgi:hypothetical protein